MRASAASDKFVSQEEYFPVFDNNSPRPAAARGFGRQQHHRVLHLHEGDARLAAEAVGDADTTGGDRRPAAAGAADKRDAWHTALVNVIYLLYLGYESARKAVNDLIEFQPARAERSIIILLTELKCYAFLRKHFTSDDLRRKRLSCARTGYRRDIRKLYREVEASAGHSDELWVQARKRCRCWSAGTTRRSATIWRPVFRVDAAAAAAVSRPTGVNTELST